nr:MAG TPA: DNA binding protein [Microviridae sp.]
MTKLYQVKDVKAGFVSSPFKQPNNAYAIRTFAETVNKDTFISTHAEDYQLFYVGEQNENTGEITSNVVFLENASNVVIEKPKEK